MVSVSSNQLTFGCSSNKTDHGETDIETRRENFSEIPSSFVFVRNQCLKRCNA